MFIAQKCQMKKKNGVTICLRYPKAESCDGEVMFCDFLDCLSSSMMERLIEMAEACGTPEYRIYGDIHTAFFDGEYYSAVIMMALAKECMIEKFEYFPLCIRTDDVFHLPLWYFGVGGRNKNTPYCISNGTAYKCDYLPGDGSVKRNGSLWRFIALTPIGKVNLSR